MVHFRTEVEMMCELALIAVKETDGWEIDGSVYTLPDGRGQTFVYDMAYLDVRFIESQQKDCVCRFTSKLAPNTPAFYCLMSELNTDDEE